MSTVVEIESAIQSLSIQEQAELMQRLEEPGFLRASTAALFKMLDEEEDNHEPQWLGDDPKTAGET